MHNSGILPLTFQDEADYEKISQGDELEIQNLQQGLREGETLLLKNRTTGAEIPVLHSLSGRQIDIMLAGGLLNFTKTGA